MQNKDIYLYKAKILKWYDGDTLTANIDLGFKIYSKVRVRLARINSWELNSSSSYRRRFAKHARAVAQKKFPIGESIIISLKKKDRYGRWLAEVFHNDKNISDTLLNSGEKGFEKYR